MEIFTYGLDKIEVRNKLSEITLGELLQMMELEKKIQDWEDAVLSEEIEGEDDHLDELLLSEDLSEEEFQRALQSVEFPSEFDKEVREFEKMIAETERYLERDELILSQLKLLSSAEYHDMLSRLTADERLILKSKFVMDISEVKSETSVHIPQVNHAQIAELEEQVKEYDESIHVREIFELKTRIKRLSENALVLSAVQEAAFASKMVTDRLREDFPSIPPQIEKYLIDKGITWEEYLEGFHNQPESLQEQRDKLERDKLVLGYQRDSTHVLLQKSAQILTHFLLPVGEKYSLKWAKEREKFIYQIPASTAYGMINFILTVLRIWRGNTVSSMMLQAKKLRPENVRNIVENTDGFRLLQKSLRAKRG